MIKYFFLVALLCSCKMSIDFDHGEQVKMERQKIDSCPALKKGFDSAGKKLKKCIGNASKSEYADGHIDLCLWVYGVIENPPEGYIK